MRALCFWKSSGLVLCLLVAWCDGVWAKPTKPQVAKREYLDNGVVRLGVNLSIGGAITYFADVSPTGDKANMVNSHDWGRQVQMSHYSGPSPFEPDGKKPHSHWVQLGWNPIQSGDCFGHASKILKCKNDGKSIYVKCIPMHWPLDNQPAECVFETWITLEGRSAKVRSRITNRRSDKTWYAARPQELPAVYTNGPWYRLMTYLGTKPFTGGAMTEIPIKKKGKGIFPWSRFEATEHWAALLDKNGKGMGVWTPGVQKFNGGFSGKPGAGGPTDSPTGHLAPIHLEILDHNIQYEYHYRLIAGTAEQIREIVYKAHRANAAPVADFRFQSDRQHWSTQKATDAGWPLKGFWAVQLGASGGRIVSPRGCWSAKACPVLEITAAFRTASPVARVSFTPFQEDASAPKKAGAVPFPVINDGKVRTYRVSLAGHHAYQGAIRQFSLSAGGKGKKTQSVRVYRIRCVPLPTKKRTPRHPRKHKG